MRALLGVLAFTAAATAAHAATLSNGELKAQFGPRGLTVLADTRAQATFQFRRDEFSIAIDGTTHDSATLPAPTRTASKDRVTYTWTAGPARLDVVYELQPGWRFLSKQIVVPAAPSERFRIGDIELWNATLAVPPREVYVQPAGRQNLGLGHYGGFLRFESGAGLIATAQNPFLAVTHEGAGFAVRYAAELEWQREYGAFSSDRGLLAPHRLSGRHVPAQMVPEWQMDTAALAVPGTDQAEVEAFTGMVRAFLRYEPERPLRIFVGWCVNDYQIDIATEDGRAEYKRVLDRAAELGAEHVLFAPTNSELGRREDSVDDWNWENLLWLGLGQKLRKGEWDPATGEIPAGVREMLDHARSRRLSLVAYVYPVVAFSQNPEWLVTRRNAPGGKKYASLAFRSLQDWLIETLVAFHRRTGISGYAFDHTFLGFDGPGSYAQWWGWRRVMETLRERIPDVVIDGRQAYHLYGPWGWLAGSYPHPTYSDEQPESFVPFPDLSFDRVSAARQRYTAYRFRNYDYAPSEIVPGFIAHQTGRNDDTGQMPQTKTDKGILLNRFRARDWDHLGWRYSLLSSIATAGWNHVINMIPARDLEEYRHFSEADKAWFRRWLDWTDAHKEILRRTRTILGQPALGKIDGTAAVHDDRGFVFLFNPNARRVGTQLALDATLGLTRPGRYVLRELHPVEGRALGKPASGPWSLGDRVDIEMDGQSALVLELLPATATDLPRLFSASGTASLEDGRLELRGVRGEVGTRTELLVQLPPGQTVTGVRVNGREVAFAQAAPDVVTASVAFDGTAFSRAQPVGAYDASFAGGTFTGRFTVPRRVFDQLEARQKAWPIPWAPEDFRATWLAPQRLLLYVQIAEPDDRWEPRLRIDGRLVELKKAYSAIRAARRTFVGFYADVSLVAADREHRLELELPPLKPGQFQGVFFQNVETEYTDVVTER